MHRERCLVPPSRISCISSKNHKNVNLLLEISCGMSNCICLSWKTAQVSPVMQQVGNRLVLSQDPTLSQSYNMVEKQCMLYSKQSVSVRQKQSKVKTGVHHPVPSYQFSATELRLITRPHNPLLRQESWVGFLATTFSLRQDNWQEHIRMGSQSKSE